MDHQDDGPRDVFEALADLASYLDAQLRDALASRSHVLEALDFERRRAAAAEAENRALRAALGIRRRSSPRGRRALELAR